MYVQFGLVDIDGPKQLLILLYFDAISLALFAERNFGREPAVGIDSPAPYPTDVTSPFGPVRDRTCTGSSGCNARRPPVCATVLKN